MSWVKRRGHATSNPAPPQPMPMYDPNQHAPQTQQWQPADLQGSANNWFDQNSQNQYAYNPPHQQDTQQYWQQNYTQQPNQNANQINQHNQQQPDLYNTRYQQQNNYTEPQFNVPSSIEQLNNSLCHQQETDTWNWGWGDEDNSNVQTPANSNATASNVDSFVNDKTWDWSLGSETSEQKEKSFPKVGQNGSDLELKPKVTHLTAFKSENLTPQWSVESQMSQDSSDDIVHTSESDKSHKMSRSSTISQSPISGQELNVEVKQDRIASPVSPRVENQNSESLGNREILTKREQLSVAFPRTTATPPKNQGPPLQPNQNPYKKTSLLSHKSANAFASSQGANLEMLPDNAEQPDLPELRKIPSVKPAQQWQGNVEITAPINDRNQYLETGQLSDVDVNRSESDNNHESGPYQQQESDTLPPPGLRRMVLGQIEQEANPNSSTNEEPPPGLSRMVLGQTENALQPDDPPLGVRMIPGESSSPETISRQNYTSDVELSELTAHVSPQPRSETIGADTPPSATNVNRSETIGSDTQDQSRLRADGLDEDAEIANLTNVVRDLTVGENTKDEGGEPKRRTSRQESSDSDAREPSPRSRRRQEERGGKGRSRERYSPDNYKEKRRYRDRRYEEDTDYYSEKERERRSREEYDRKYSSLKKEKEKERRRRDPRDYDRRDYYYSRYEEDYDNDTRPSSRTDSMHDNYRERVRDHRRHRDRDRERDHHRRPRDAHHGYMQMYGYDPYSPYYQQYHYYENLRRTNPQAYAEWYRKYYQQAAGQTATYGTEDRASVHSGRSSANDELAKDRYTRQSYYSQSSLPQMGGYYRDSHSISGHYGLDASSYGRPFEQTDSSLNLEDTTLTSQRLTPAKFATAHVKLSIQSGLMVRIPPHYPLDGQTASVDLGTVQALLHSSDEYKELANFPGPLIRGITHKKTIIEYCENKIKQASCLNITDCQSYILMWELLILLIRQNGMVVGTDIAELLMKNGNNQEVNYRPPSTVSSVSNDALDFQEHSEGSTTAFKEEFVTNKFREYLIHGSGKEALEWAMKHGLWGHALFLASKLDKRTYANVMMRFANGLTMNDPLQTLYQLLSGRIPAAVTCVADEKWGDWKPHLAMILSNTTQRPELDRKAITTLADTLLSRGSLYAAQFCYLMAQVEFGRYGHAETKLTLLGSNHTKPFRQFATSEAIFMTEIYEYACSLNESSFLISEFQPYKYLLATRLADVGLLEKSLAYLERLANIIVQNPGTCQPTLIENVSKLADRLKFHDLSDETEDAANYADETYNRPDSTWLKDLRNVVQQAVYQNVEDRQQQENEEAWQQQQQQQRDYEQVQQQNIWQTQQEAPQFEVQTKEQSQSEYSATPAYQNHQQPYWDNQQQWTSQSVDSGQYGYQETTSQPQNDYWNNTSKDAASRPQISMPNQSRGYDEPDEESATHNEPKKDSPAKPKAVPVKQDKSSSSGWFGGIWSKLAPKPKNQMKLPDDKNPTIVWDSDKKKWINLEEESTEGSVELKPPPKMSELIQPKVPPGIQQHQFHEDPHDFLSTDQYGLSQPMSLDSSVNALGLGRTPDPIDRQDQRIIEQPKIGAALTSPKVGQAVRSETAALPPKPAQQNMFKLQRSRNLKKSYVDVFNPGNKSSGPASLPPQDAFPAMAQSTQMNFFIPQPVANQNAPTDFLTPVPQIEDSAQLSRWSSASSLSREVQSYLRHKPPPIPR